MISFLPSFLFSLTISASGILLHKDHKLEFDKTEQRKDLKLYSAKYDSTRIYHAKIFKKINAPLKEVTEKILHFEQRCNNEYKDLRKNFDKSYKCPFYNPNVIEVIVHPIIDKTKDPKSSFVLTRYIKNMELYVINELVTTKKISEDKIEITVQSIGDKEFKALTGSPLKSNSALKKITSKFELSKSKDSTLLDYTYEMETDHWLINKGMAVSNVFDNMQKNINQFVESLGKKETKI
jgi:hypothetical protein